MTKNFLHDLNEQQQEAVLHEEGPALVLAGAGSGKTRVLTTRAAWLINQQKANPEEILLVTFTNKAAQEMNNRVQQLAGLKLPYSGTFHSICARILRVEAEVIGLHRDFIIYDADDQVALLKQLYKKKGISRKDLNVNAVKAEISNAKNALQSPSEYQEKAYNHFQRNVAELYTLYNMHLKQNQAVDFDDLLLLVVRFLQNAAHVRQKYQQRFTHVLVDEYQDTNTVQYQLTKLLAAPQNNLFVVGDFSQSIYAWRGADYRNMKLLSEDFPDITTYKLEQNYRSTQSILDAATKVIAQNKDKHEILELWTENDTNRPLQLIEAATSDLEAELVIKYIREKLQPTYSYGDAAVLYRTNAQSRAFEEACLKYGIPYRLIGGFKFYERKEVKDVLAYLRIAINPLDSVSMQRAEKNGKRVFKKYKAWLENKNTDATPYDLLQEILKVTQYETKYDETDPDDASRLENIQELLNVANQFKEISTFLENIALIQDDAMKDVDFNADNHSLTLMSLHAAKGLEFPVVFMAGMEDGLLPHSRSLFDTDQMDEERRLCYVGITRAKEHLIFSFARKRWMYGSSSSTTRSRFLQDVPSEVLELSDLSSAQHSYTNGNSSWYQGNKNTWNTSSSTTSTKSTKRRVIIDDDELDALLDGDLDLDSFLS